MSDTNRILLFDLDGTLANIDHRHLVQGKAKQFGAFDAACVDDVPNEHVVAIWRAMFTCGRPYQHWIVSGRSEAVREQTERWLAAHYLKWHRLFMRPVGDYTPDEQLKRFWIEPFKDRVSMAFDDRSKVVAMWRSLGIPCLQVAPGDF